MNKLQRFDIEFIEQPTDCESLSALSQVKANSPIAIAADQCAFTPYDVFDICHEKAADLIVLGLHETGAYPDFARRRLSQELRVSIYESLAGMGYCQKPRPVAQGACQC